MLKFLREKSGYGSQPGTPKISLMTLPDAPTPMRSDTPRRTPTPAIPISRPGTPNIASPRPVNPIPRIGSHSPRASTPIQRCSTPAAQSASPLLKSTLRQRTTTLNGVLTAEEARLAASKLRDEYIPPRNYSTPMKRERSTPMPQEKTIPSTPKPRDRKFSMTAGGPPEPTKVSSPPRCYSTPPQRHEAIQLHWQLLSRAPDATNRRLRFDIAHPVSCMKYEVSRLDRLAARLEDGNFAEMTIKGDFLTKSIRIRRPDGIRCRDVFDAIHDSYSQVLSEREIAKIPEDDRAEVDAACEARCAKAPGLTAVEKRAGLRRVDLLRGRTVFSGLWEQENGTWLLHLSRH
ncbi:hypothetical protein HWV62_37091 [Athelia sp. TMB]|nr:hypothetical protein HWV62_37091 [Athelia sp. TMB]